MNLKWCHQAISLPARDLNSGNASNAIPFKVPSSKFQVPSSEFSPPQALCESVIAL
jgi:hypothetical protein